jgi:hypothetical protein
LHSTGFILRFSCSDLHVPGSADNIFQRLCIYAQMRG